MARGGCPVDSVRGVGEGSGVEEGWTAQGARKTDRKDKSVGWIGRGHKTAFLSGWWMVSGWLMDVSG